MKLGRTYKLKVYNSPNNPVPDVTIAYPLTIKFQVTNNYRTTGNAAHFMIYNLNETTRQALYRDLFDLVTTYRGLIFEAGYETDPNLTTIFSGDIRWAYSYRQGPDWITEIDTYDGGMAMEKAQITLTAGSVRTLPWLLQTMIKTMEPYNVRLGRIGQFDFTGNTSDRSGNPTRGIAVSGSTWSELTRIMAPYKANCFISKGLAYVLNWNEYLPDASTLRELSNDTGLIGTPRISGGSIKATMIFEPRIEVGQILSIKSSETSTNTAIKAHGDNIVHDVIHTGTISGAVGGDALTSIEMFVTSSPTPVAA